MPDAEAGSVGKYHCQSCIRKTALRVREAMWCGFLPREQWAPARQRLPVLLGPERYTADVCPGWLVRQPAVAEGVEAYDALEAGILERWDPRGLRVVTMAAMRARRSFKIWEAERQREIARRMR